MLTAGTTGYFPNPSEAAVADTYHGPFRVLGNPHRGDSSCTSFHSQISSVFRVPGKKDLYIACADRWVPDLMDIEYDFYRQVYEAMFTGREREIPGLVEAYHLDERKVKNVLGDQDRNTSIADYVWLPLCFSDPCDEHPYGMVWIDWKDEWKIEEYD